MITGRVDGVGDHAEAEERQRHDEESAAARAERREFAMFRDHLRWFGYEFFLLQRS